MEQVQIVQNKIYEVRGQRVMLDRDLAELYGVETKILNKAVKRNIERFPERFMFQLTKEEAVNLKFQIGTSSWGGTRKLPYVFTEQGVSMLSAVLHSQTAVQVCLVIMDAYVAMRTALPAVTTATTLPSALADAMSSIERRMAQLEQSQKHTQQMIHIAFPSMVQQQLPQQLPLPSIPEFFSAEVKIVSYSDKAMVIFTNSKEDKLLLKAIGARYNSWLTWEGESAKGWIYPKSRIGDLYHHIRLPEQV